MCCCLSVVIIYGYPDGAGRWCFVIRVRGPCWSSPSRATGRIAKVSQACSPCPGSCWYFPTGWTTASSPMTATWRASRWPWTPCASGWQERFPSIPTMNITDSIWRKCLEQPRADRCHPGQPAQQLRRSAAHRAAGLATGRSGSPARGDCVAVGLGNPLAFLLVVLALARMGAVSACTCASGRSPGRIWWSSATGSPPWSSARRSTSRAWRACPCWSQPACSLGGGGPRACRCRSRPLMWTIATGGSACLPEPPACPEHSPDAQARPFERGAAPGSSTISAAWRWWCPLYLGLGLANAPCAAWRRAGADPVFAARSGAVLPGPAARPADARADHDRQCDRLCGACRQSPGRKPGRLQQPEGDHPDGQHGVAGCWRASGIISARWCRSTTALPRPAWWPRWIRNDLVRRGGAGPSAALGAGPGGRWGGPRAATGPGGLAALQDPGAGRRLSGGSRHHRPGLPRWLVLSGWHGVGRCRWLFEAGRPFQPGTQPGRAQDRPGSGREAVLNRCPGVLESAVVAAAAEASALPVLVAVIVAAQGSRDKLVASELQAACLQELGPMYVPAQVVLVEACQERWWQADARCTVPQRSLPSRRRPFDVRAVPVGWRATVKSGLLRAAALVCACLAGLAFADDTVRIVVPVNAGGSNDLLMRQLSRHLEDRGHARAGREQAGRQYRDWHPVRDRGAAGWPHHAVCGRYLATGRCLEAVPLRSAAGADAGDQARDQWNLPGRPQWPGAWRPDRLQQYLRSHPRGVEVAPGARADVSGLRAAALEPERWHGVVPYPGIMPALTALMAGRGHGLPAARYGALATGVWPHTRDWYCRQSARLAAVRKLPLLKDTWPGMLMASFGGIYLPAAARRAVVEQLNRDFNWVLWRNPRSEPSCANRAMSRSVVRRGVGQDPENLEVDYLSASSRRVGIPAPLSALSCWLHELCRRPGCWLCCRADNAFFEAIVETSRNRSGETVAPYPDRAWHFDCRGQEISYRELLQLVLIASGHLAAAGVGGVTGWLSGCPAPWGVSWSRWLWRAWGASDRPAAVIGCPHRNGRSCDVARFLACSWSRSSPTMTRHPIRCGCCPRRICCGYRKLWEKLAIPRCPSMPMTVWWIWLSVWNYWCAQERSRATRKALAASRSIPWVATTGQRVLVFVDLSTPDGDVRHDTQPFMANTVVLTRNASPANFLHWSRATNQLVVTSTGLATGLPVCQGQPADSRQLCQSSYTIQLAGSVFAACSPAWPGPDDRSSHEVNYGSSISGGLGRDHAGTPCPVSGTRMDACSQVEALRSATKASLCLRVKSGCCAFTPRLGWRAIWWRGGDPQGFVGGWYCPGDRGSVDGSGLLRLVGRDSHGSSISADARSMPRWSRMSWIRIRPSWSLAVVAVNEDEATLAGAGCSAGSRSIRCLGQEQLRKRCGATGDMAMCWSTSSRPVPAQECRRQDRSRAGGEKGGDTRMTTPGWGFGSGKFRIGDQL